MDDTTNDDGRPGLERLRARAPNPPPDWMMRRLVLVPAIIGLNVLVTLAWWIAQSQARRISPEELVDGGGPALLGVLWRHFVISPLHLQEGLHDALLGAAFSHLELWHLLLNMFVLWSFGSLLEKLWGRRLFAGFYLGAAVFANLAHCAVSLWLLRDPESFALGASGAVSGLLIAYSLLFPHHKILLFGIVPLPAWGGALLFVGLDVWGLTAQARGGGLPIGHGAHLGGALAGLVLWLLVLRSRFPRERLRPPQPDRPAIRITRDEAQRLEELRRKMESDGVDALTPKERAFLEELRRRAHGG